MSDDFFDELNAEIEKALAKSKLKDDAAKAKKLAFDRTVGRRVREKAIAEWQTLQAILEAEQWTPVSVVAMFSEQHCDGCGSTHRLFLQYMEQQNNIRKSAGKRWIRVAYPSQLLPHEVMIQPHRTHICPDCCEDHGFHLSQATPLTLSTSALNISETYLQGDINGPSEIN